MRRLARRMAQARRFAHMHDAYIMDVVNTWTEAKRARNLADHGIDLAGLEGFFVGDLLTREDTREAYREPRFQSIGLFHGVVLFVVWTPRGEHGDIPHLISARKAVAHEQKAWFQRYRKH